RVPCARRMRYSPNLPWTAASTAVRAWSPTAIACRPPAPRSARPPARSASAELDRDAPGIADRGCPDAVGNRRARLRRAGQDGFAPVVFADDDLERVQAGGVSRPAAGAAAVPFVDGD